jgi:hypothetical protein
MASIPSRLVAHLLARALEPLVRVAPLKVRLDTGQRLVTRVELVTDPVVCLTVIPFPAGAESVQAEDMPGCVVEYIDYYDQDGIRFARMSFFKAIRAGETVTIPVIVSAW